MWENPSANSSLESELFIVRKHRDLQVPPVHTTHSSTIQDTNSSVSWRNQVYSQLINLCSYFSATSYPTVTSFRQVA